MRHRWFILVAVLLLVLIGGAVAAFAYDSSRDDVIAKGVTIAGVNVGGMTTTEARAADDAGDRSAFGRSGDAEVVEAGTTARTRLARAAEERLIDVAAGEGAHLAADHGAGERCAEHGDAGRQQGRADRGTSDCEGKRGHQESIPGKEKAAARWRRHQRPNGTSATARLSMAWIIEVEPARMPTCFATACAR